MKLLDVHPSSVRAPWYATGDTAALHRSFDESFVTAYLDALQSGRLNGLADNTWMSEDRLGDYDEVVLRQPLHRAFYLLAAEVGCALAGDHFVAVDPAKVSSAGFVIRRASAVGDRAAWSLVDGEVHGWTRGSANSADPDVRRRLAQVEGASPFQREAPFTGEQVHPMHVVATADAKGAKHTVLYGFMPLSSSVSVQQPRGESDAHEHASDVLGEFFGPFRSAAGESDDGLRVIDNGLPTRAFVELLRVLVLRYRVGLEATNPDNVDLENWLASIRYPTLIDDDLADRVLGMRSGWTLLTALRAALDSESSDLQSRLVAEPSVDVSASPTARLTRLRGLTDDCTLTSTDVDTLRTLLVSRFGRQLAASDRRIVVPRFGQDDDDVYVAVPFARVVHDGCESVVWGPESVPFRVAGPFDPELSPAVSIPMPRLADLRRGLAKAEFRLPEDLAKTVLGLKRDEADVVETPANTFGVQWIVSFSIPIVTICAMIVLMIVMAILDIVFKWMPFAIVRTPIFTPRKGS